METQPQLLLLQKTMLVAEGVGRKLDPDSNIWMLAEPLVEEWGLEWRGPEGRMREFVSEVAARAERLPQLLESVDLLSDIITADGLRLHPETIDAFRQNNGFARYWRVGFVVLALLLVASFIADF